MTHQHGNGQLCTYHDHLLRHHSTAGAACDAAANLLHWHWQIPSGSISFADDSSEYSENDVHSCLDPEESCWEHAPAFDRVRPPSLLKRGQWRRIAGSSFVAFAATPSVPSPAPHERRPISFGATLTSHSSLSAWLVRWTC